MKSHAPLILAALLTPALARADEPLTTEPQFFARALAGASFGNLDDGLRAMVRGYTVESEIQWPASFALVGAALGVRGPLSSGRRWEVTISALTRVAGPFGQTLDQDWYTGPMAPRTEISHSESRTEGTALLVDLGARLELVSLSRAARPAGLDLVAGYRHEYFNVDAWGGEIWQELPPMPRRSGTLPDSYHGANFQSHLNLPYVGLALRADVGRTSLDAQVVAMLAFSSNVDDHVERHKLGTAEALGAGVGVTLRPRVALHDPRSRVGFALGLDLQLRYVSTTGTLHQHYYVDDPSVGANTATAIPDSDYFLRSLLGVALLTLDASF